MRRNFFIVNVYVILLIRFQENNFERPKGKYGKGKYGRKVKVNINNNASEIARIFEYVVRAKAHKLIVFLQLILSAVVCLHVRNTVRNHLRL